ncbi:MAG: hypothetical protein CM1200mP30_18350 [Pseudomonadota bacterium]|nr:MAG: hypothetical protein CM1200mP30_18350 [Pseudomonadota bacterium]
MGNNLPDRNIIFLGLLKIHHVRIIKTGIAGFVAAFVFAAWVSTWHVVWLEYS